MGYISKRLKVKGQRLKAFTIIELVVTIAILGIISGIITTIVVRSGIIFERQQGTVETGLANRFVLDEIVNQTRAAAQIEENFTGNGQSFTTGGQTLILKLPSIDSSGEIIPGSFDRVVFYKDSEKIYQKVYPDTQSTRTKTSQILTAATKTLNFSYNNPTIASASAVTVNLTTIKSLPSGDRENTDKIEVVLRNY